MILKNIAFKITKWLGLVIACLLILITILLSSLRFTTPYLQSHNQQIEAWTSSVIGRPIKISKIEVGYFGFEPIITLYDVTVLNSQGEKPVFELHKLSLGVDFIGSLLKRHIEVGLLVIDGATLDLYQTQDGKVHWTIFDEKSSVVNAQKEQNEQENRENIAVSNEFRWLLTQGKIVLNNVNVIWQPLVGKSVKLSQVKLRLVNGLIYNRIMGQGDISQEEKVSSMLFSIKFRGNILENTSLPMVKGDVTVNNYLFNLNDVSFQGSDESRFFTKFLPQKGIINLHLHKFVFDCNKLWEKSRTFASIDGKVEWQKTNDNQWLLKIKDFKTHNVDLQTNGSINLSFQSGIKSPICDLQLHFNTKFLEAFSKYFPDKALPKGVINWLDQAFKSGEASGVIILQGELDHFPFTNHDGNFLVNIDLNDVAFNYHHAWPMLNHLDGRVVVSGKSMHIVADSAEITDIPVYHVTAVIPDLVKAVIEVNSQAYSDSAKGLRFISLSPLKNDFGKGLQDVFLQGPMRLNLKLIIPIASDTGVSTQILGMINLNGNTLNLSSWNLYLDDIHGNLTFTEDSINGNDIRGILFDNPIDLNVSTVKENKSSRYKVAFTGALDIDALQRHLKFPFNHYLQGSTEYGGVLTLLPTSSVSNSNNTLEITSHLQGITIYVPPLLKKAENEKKDFKLNLSFSNNSPEQDVLVNYNDVMSAALSFEKTAKKTQFVGGQLNLSDNNAKIPTKNGLFVTANLGKVDWSEWQRLLFSENKESEIKSVKDLISQIDLKISELRVFGQVLKAVKLSILPDKQNWTASIQSSNIAGNIVVPTAFPQGVLKGKLQKVYLQSSDSKQQNKKTISPKGLPGMDFAIDDFRYGNKAIGKVIVKANPIDSGLNLSQLQIISANFQLDASGRWEQFNGASRSFLNGKCSSQNVGNAFKQLHFTGSLDSGVGAANFALGWSGTVYDLDLPSLDGNVSVDIRKGRIVNLSSTTEAEMGIGRLLNILSLQSLSRRLSLDFSDLVKNGFSFDILSGTFKLVKGDAFTQDVQLKGPVAQVSVKGRIGFAAKDLDMNLAVVPQLTSSLPVIATVAGGPVVGAGVWLANKMIGGQVTKAVASYAYRVKGSWVDPDVQKL